MKMIRKLFEGQTMAAILEQILQGTRKSDLAMVYVLEVRMKAKLRSCYDRQKCFLSSEFEDTINELFVYLREGKRKSNIVRYEVIRKIKNRESFPAWLVKTYHYFLINLSVYEKRINKVSIDGNVKLSSEQIDIEPWMTEERRISIASKVIAYVYQISSEENRVVFIRWLMNHYKNDCPNSNKEIAEMLGCSYLTLRVRLFRISKKVNAVREQLMRTGTLPLDGEHLRMSEAIKSSFSDLSPLFLKYYRACLFVKTGLMEDF